MQAPALQPAAERLHEDPTQLSADLKDRRRAIVSLVEELEAIDWYGQRAEAAGDEQLRKIFAHNRAEEVEHAAMLLEWLRRHDERFGQELGRRLFREGPIVRKGSDAAHEPSDLAIGSLRPRRTEGDTP